MTKKKKLTELEGATLAVVAMEGSATAYFVKEVFRRSPSDMWSGSAGAIYPLVKRLEKSGLLTAEDSADGARKRTLFSLSSAGERAMRAWLFDAERAAGLGLDPLRTRLYFISNLPQEELGDFLAEVDQHCDKAPPEVGNALSDRIHQLWIDKRREALKEVPKIFRDTPLER